MDITKTEIRRIPLEKLHLDPHNPRFLHLELKGQKTLTQALMEAEIAKDDATMTLSKAIHREGVLNPVVVQERKDGTFLVVDGNRRTVTLKLLARENAKAPKGISFKEVPARVIPAGVDAADVEVLKGVLQEGQKSWGAFNDAAYVHRLRYTYKMELDDIADRLQLSVKKVKDRLRDFEYYRQYSSATKDTDPDRYSYFHEAPPKVRKWFEGSDDNLHTYFGLITPGAPTNKIRSVATTGGLRDFAKVLEDEEATKAFITNKKIGMEQAMEIARENNLKLAAPFLGRIGTWSAQLSSIDDTQLAMIQHEPRLKIELVQLQEAVERLLKKLEK